MKNNKELVRKERAPAPALRDPFDEIANFSTALEGLWEGFPFLGHHHHHIRLPVASGVRSWSPSVNVRETAKEYVLSADLPGVDKKDVKVSVDEGVLTLRGERRGGRTSKEGGSLSWFGSFQRSFALPGNVKTSGIKANYKKGHLTVTLPRLKEPARAGGEIAVR